MLAKRVIPCLDVQGGRVVKGVRFVELRDAGDPVEAARAYDAQGADELVFLDITASHEGRATMLDVVRRTAEGMYMPLTVGGGVGSLEDVRTLLRAGADKVSLNTAALARPELVMEAARAFGSQCIVVAIDAKREAAACEASRRRAERTWKCRGNNRRHGAEPPRWGVYTHGGRRPAGRDARRVGPRGRGARRRRDPADEHGPRRHRRRLRPRADARGVRGGRRCRDRLRAARERWPTSPTA